MSEIYLLDTSALFAFTKDEKGSDFIERILNKSDEGKLKVIISLISLLEIFYITWEEKSEQDAKELVIYTKALSVGVIDINEKIIFIAGRLKAEYKLGVADSIIAATAIYKKAILVHKDPDMEKLKNELRTIELPYKKRVKSSK